MKQYSNLKASIIIGLVFIIGLSLRLTGLNWDQGHHLHPDERFLTMVANDIKMPASVSDYFNTSTSPLNPYNYSQYQFFVYGTLPLFLTKTVAVVLHLDNYDQLHLVGRVLSTIFDSINIFLLFILSKHLFSKSIKKLIIIPSLLYAACILPIQLSHFFAVDTFLTTFLLATFTLLVSNYFFLAAITFGLALTCKISAIYFLPIIGLFLLRVLTSSKNIFRSILVTCYFFLVTIFIFRIFQPYAFTGAFKVNPQFIDNIHQLVSMSSAEGNYPPSVQWLSKTPIPFSLQNIIFFGLGIPATLIFIFSIYKHRLTLPYIIKFSLIWITILFLYQGSQFAHSMRYFLVIYPFLCLVTAYFAQGINLKLLKIFLIGHLTIAALFINIYLHPHSRVQASNWIYQNLPAGASITNEYWDDPLPMYLPDHNPNDYSGIMISPYDPDSPEKIEKLYSQINSADYIIMSSNRLWGSIPLVPDKYPLTSQFYKDLFSEKLNFYKLVEINSYPGISIPFFSSCYYFGPSNFPGVTNPWFTIDTTCNYPGIYVRDDLAEEAFSVYDHPKVLIFSRHNN